MENKNLTFEFDSFISKNGKQCETLNIYAVDKEGVVYLVKKVFLTDQEKSIIKLASK